MWGFLLNTLKCLVLAATYFCLERLSSVLQGLTALFEMGKGVTLATNHQDKAFKRTVVF
jgi:hypothetical protein